MEFIFGASLFWWGMGLPAAIIVGWLWVQFLRWLLPLPYHPDETHTIDTPDGWQLPLYRWKPVSGTTQRRFPVVMCHGVGGNHHDLDFDQTYSFARFLCRHGYDCWVMDMRAGGSPLIVPPEGTHRHDYCFDDLVRQDVTSAIQAVLSNTSAEQVHWVGHSLGGLVIYAFGNGPSDGQRPGEPSPLRSLTAIASRAQASHDATHD